MHSVVVVTAARSGSICHKNAHHHPTPAQPTACHAPRPHRRCNCCTDLAHRDAPLVPTRRASVASAHQDTSLGLACSCSRASWAYAQLPFRGQGLTCGVRCAVVTSDRSRKQAHPKGTARMAATRASRRTSARPICSNSVGRSAAARWLWAYVPGHLQHITSALVH